ncbi:group II intron reverse transcriptase/maturase [SAR92 clade bacterium H455]|uniref:Group II intron reverse transcriptase/maturase n=1 Tax=SAR92 clade bacterium H455 TaxID=2974818 RepID=A0ABY5TM26_9GAMM|nr:group II intron reverse transcriptase/maturase [SAR92 clade bacterium H455]
MNMLQSDLYQNRWVRIRLTAGDKDVVFNNLLTHIDKVSLCEAYKAIDGSKALGIDGVSKRNYGKQLEVNLENLLERIHKGTYKPQAKREVLIPKADGKQRPLAIGCFEDKLVEWTVAKILGSVYEPVFIRNSFGFRSDKSAHQAIQATYKSLKNNKRPHVVEIDFARFFNTIPHRKMMKILGRRITDRRFKGLVGRLMQAAIQTADGVIKPTVVGSPQGSIASPVLANIYLNEMLDQWFIENYASYSVIVRYADDPVFLFRSKAKAKSFVAQLNQRVAQYGLELNQEKTRIINFHNTEKTQFDFLGFTFYWGIGLGLKRRLKVKTQKKQLHKKIQEFDHWVKKIRNQLKTSEIWALAKAKLRGHYNYFGYAMNWTKLNHFYYEAVRSLFKWLNRRSQKCSYNWEGFKERLEQFPLGKPPPTNQLRKLEWSTYV